VPFRISVAPALLALCAGLAADVSASTFYFLARNDRICAQDGPVCIRATISYDTNSRVLHLRGRVDRAAEPGWLRLTFVGISERNQRGSTTMEFPIRGNWSEVLDHKLIPDHPPIADWRLEAMSFVADERPDNPPPPGTR
jgi:hypothetical protein